jgi:hypothetical protein
MSAEHDEKSDESRHRRDTPKREPARTLWLCDLHEWKQFQAGELTAAELKQRYADLGGDAE